MLEKLREKMEFLDSALTAISKTLRKNDSMMPLSAIYQMVLHKEVT